MLQTLDTNDEYRPLEARLNTLLPEEYQDSYEDVQPVSMGSAGMKYGKDGRVAWDEIWRSFCDLAMAGGPPHRGTLLEPATKAEIDLQSERYVQVVDELCRGVEMVTGLAAEPSRVHGWIDVDCPSTSMAGWLVRAINMENVSAHAYGMVLHLPAGPHFRLEKEIKNVVTSIAKTCHYWLGHTSVAQHRAIAELFKVMENESPLIQAPFSKRNTSTRKAGTAGFDKLRNKIAADILSQTGLQATGREYHDWLGIDCLKVRSAIWMMRVMVVSNVLARRESNSLYIPLNPSMDRNGKTVAGLVARAYRVACVQGITFGERSSGREVQEVI
jgi:sirohydrochlorin cobaltochelatase